MNSEGGVGAQGRHFGGARKARAGRYWPALILYLCISISVFVDFSFVFVYLYIFLGYILWELANTDPHWLSKRRNIYMYFYNCIFVFVFVFRIFNCLFQKRENVPPSLIYSQVFFMETLKWETEPEANAAVPRFASCKNLPHSQVLDFYICGFWLVFSFCTELSSYSHKLWIFVFLHFYFEFSSWKSLIFQFLGLCICMNFYLSSVLDICLYIYVCEYVTRKL